MSRLIELDDGKIGTGKPFFLMVKTHGFPVKIFPTKPIPDVTSGSNPLISPGHGL
jgi:hypothetical protein